jgi:(1->4)-alpha-D-glucan 1-alpha-D-glucosylmutase
MMNSLSQTLVRLLAPGVPDTYQGTELWDLSLVDPDNRRAVNYARRREVLRSVKEEFAEEKRRAEFLRELMERKEDGRIKMLVTWRGLQLRKEYPRLFSAGEYAALSAEGERAENLFAFLRTDGKNAAVVVVPRLTGRVGSGWGETVVRVPEALEGCAWRDVFSGEDVLSWRVGDLLKRFPVAVLTAS